MKDYSPGPRSGWLAWMIFPAAILVLIFYPIQMLLFCVKYAWQVTDIEIAKDCRDL